LGAPQGGAAFQTPGIVPAPSVGSSAPTSATAADASAEEAVETVAKGPGARRKRGGYSMAWDFGLPQKDTGTNAEVLQGPSPLGLATAGGAGGSKVVDAAVWPWGSSTTLGLGGETQSSSFLWGPAGYDIDGRPVGFLSEETAPMYLPMHLAALGQSERGKNLVLADLLAPISPLCPSADANGQAARTDVQPWDVGAGSRIEEIAGWRRPDVRGEPRFLPAMGPIRMPVQVGGDHGFVVKNTFINICQEVDPNDDFFNPASPGCRAKRRTSSTPATVSLPTTSHGIKPPLQAFADLGLAAAAAAAAREREDEEEQLQQIRRDSQQQRRRPGSRERLPPPGQKPPPRPAHEPPQLFEGGGANEGDDKDHKCCCVLPSCRIRSASCGLKQLFKGLAPLEDRTVLDLLHNDSRLPLASAMQYATDRHASTFEPQRVLALTDSGPIVALLTGRLLGESVWQLELNLHGLDNIWSPVKCL